MITIMNNNEFFQNVENAKGVAVVDFSATWCGPCKMLEPVFKDASNELGDKAKFLKVDVDICGDVAQKYGISAVPTIIIFKDGEVMEKSVGFIPKENILNKVRVYL